jgi:hypothetical protein
LYIFMCLIVTSIAFIVLWMFIVRTVVTSEAVEACSCNIRNFLPVACQCN